MPTNLKNLLSRSRSRNELKVRTSASGEEAELPLPFPDLNDESHSHNENLTTIATTVYGGTGIGTECLCHHLHSASPSPGILRKEASCKSLFSGMVSVSSTAIEDSRVPPMPNSNFKSNYHTHREMRKCETVLALSSFASPGNSSTSSSSGTATISSTSTSNRVRVMKDKILSTSSSTLNNLLHSSSRTTNKLFTAWKLSSSSSTSNNNLSPPNLKSSASAKTKSQLSVSGNGNENEEASEVLVSATGPLTPMNRLRKNISFTNAQSHCLLGSKFSSINSLICQDNQKEILCRLCLSVVKSEETVDFQACSCRYCKDCIEAYVNFEIQEGAYDIACPDATCEKQGVLTLDEIECLVSTEMMGKHKKFRLYREVEKDAELMWCPSPGCETVCQIHEGEKTNGRSETGSGSGNGSPSSTTLSIKCSTCQKSYCAECKLSFHPDTSCESFRRKLTKEGKLEDEDLSTIESIKKCPFCHVPIEKDSGCAQMMCKRCNHVFCWYCLASLDDDFLLRHYDKGPCKNKLGHSRASVVWHRAQVIGIFAGFGVLVLLASPLLILVAPCLLCCRCGYCANRLPDEFPVSV